MVITIDVREFEADAAHYLRRARAGETITLTEDGEPVVKLGPVPEGPFEEGSAQTEQVLDRLARQGKLIRATRNWRDLPPPVEPIPGQPLPSEVLRVMREHER